MPLLFVVLLETGLRLAGYGVSSGFLREERIKDRDVFVPNLRVAERFFGKQMARQPQSFLVDRSKPAGVFRIVVFGESAAFGDPAPEFGLSRVLRVLLEHRYPGRRFEVVNAAMTGINSHAILPIARDSVRLDADAWIVYMGNNEVVGPFGAGTVFGPKVPALPLIRGSLALKATRTGQLLDDLKDRLDPPPAGRDEWGGMTMFVENKVALDDPRMASVHANFRRNLRDILDVAASWKVPVILSTVAVNLKDCAPFASLHRPGLGVEALAAWDRGFAAGAAAQEAADWIGALDAFGEAATTDDRHAELQFRMGRCLLALGRDSEANERFQKARDLDALRFRCDGQMNEIVHEAALSRDGVVFVDSARTLDAASPGGVSGNELFHEHVHLRYEGNYLLARTLAEQVAGIYDGAAGRTPESRWLSAEECAERLALADWNRHVDALTILARINDPPFTFQYDHARQVERMSEAIRRLAQSILPDALKALDPMYRRAVDAATVDPVPLTLWTSASERAGQLESAVETARRAVELDPFDASNWHKLGHLCAETGKTDEAIAALRQSLRLDPGGYWAGNALGLVLAKEKRFEEAAAVYSATLRKRPGFGLAHLGLGTVLESMGRTNEARIHFEEALDHRVLTPDGLGRLGQFSYSRGRYAEAVTNFADAVRLDPADPQLRLNLAQSLKALGRTHEARGQLAEALKLNPTLPEAQFLVGLDLARSGDTLGGCDHFAEAVRLRPDFLEARLNYGLALYNLQRSAEALEQFEAVLKLSPANATALKLVKELRGSSR